MTPSHLELLLQLARLGLAAQVAKMSTHGISEAASALAAGEGQLMVMRQQDANPAERGA
jgi:hypothetical protein